MRASFIRYKLPPPTLAAIRELMGYDRFLQVMVDRGRLSRMERGESETIFTVVSPLPL